MSIFDYPTSPHVRKHGPRGYKDYRQYKTWLRDEFTFRCVYCLFRERWYPNEQDSFSVEHSLPKALFPDCVCCYTNLLLACVKCNALKRDHLIGCDPCREPFSSHLKVQPNGYVVGATPKGKKLIDILRINRSELVERRRMLMMVLPVLERSTRREDIEMLQFWRGFPTNLPDLRKEDPPKGNCQPGGVLGCHHCQRESRCLPKQY